MLWFDVTKSSGQKHRSGLTRTSSCLLAGLERLCGTELRNVVWQSRRGCFVDGDTNRPADMKRDDWLITPELFSEEERPGFTGWLASATSRRAAIYHDAIPLRFPEFTWPRSVSRHPHYMKLLTQFDRVIANSKSSAAELVDYWRWLGVERQAPIPVPFGADGHDLPRVETDTGRARSRVVAMIGIVEPRKNQTAVLDAAERLWAEGIEFSLKLAGRVNPHFGRLIAQRMHKLRRAGRALVHEERLDDAAVARLLAESRFTVLPSLAEGCGLPVLESLWSGVPALCSDIPALRETAEGGGCRVVPHNDGAALLGAMRELLQDDVAVSKLTADATTRALPTWGDTARAVLAAL